MAKLLDEADNNFIIKLSRNEYFYLKNILDEGEITDDDFVFEKPAGKEILNAFK